MPRALAVFVLVALGILGEVGCKPAFLDYSPPWESQRHIPIVDQSFEMANDGAYRWGFEGADGTEQWVQAAPVWSGGVVRGGYGYRGSEGPVAVSYVADQYGFQPTGNSIHPDIMRAVALQVAQAKLEPEGMWDEQGFPVHAYLVDF